MPVTGAMLFLLPDLAEDRLGGLEGLWASEAGSLTYKAAYTLLAFERCAYLPARQDIISDTARWLASNQRADGSFAPWKEHPAASDIYCTAIASLGLLAYPQFTSTMILANALAWIRDSQLPLGIWPFHEIDDGAAWGLLAMVRIQQYLGKDTPHENSAGLSQP